MISAICRFIALVLLSSVRADDVRGLPQNVIFADRVEGNAVYRREIFETFLGQFPAPHRFHVTLGDSYTGKSAILNLRIQARTRDVLPGHKESFRVRGALEPTGTSMDVVAIPSTNGTEFFFDMKGVNYRFGDSAVTDGLLTIGACISSSPLVLVDTNLNDNTVQLVGRIAAHLLDQSNKGASCSFREGGPALAIVVNKNDGAVRQEVQPGGLRALWDKLAVAHVEEMEVIHQVFGDIQLHALPYESDLSTVRDLRSAFGQKVSSIDEHVTASTLPVMLPFERNPTSPTVPTAAMIAAAIGDLTHAMGGFLFHEEDAGGAAAPADVDSFLHVALDACNQTMQDPSDTPSVKHKEDTIYVDADGGVVESVSDMSIFLRPCEFVAPHIARTAAACLKAFHSAAARHQTPACDERCSVEAGGCQVVHEWLAPARAAAEKCFVDATAKWREGGNPFGASVLDPALKQLNADTQHRADELHNAWQQANSVDPARTQHESRTRKFRSDLTKCSGRYGSRCYGMRYGGRMYRDYCTYSKIVEETRSCTFKRCGVSLGCTDWAEASSIIKEMSRVQRNIC